VNAIIELLGGWRATAFAMLAALGWAGYGIASLRLTHAQDAMTAHLAADKAAQTAAELAARTRELQMATATAQISASYERGKSDAQTAADAVAAGLRAGTVRLRAQWRGCEASRVSNAAAAARELNAAEQSRADSAGAIVRAASQCDAQVRGLQAILVSERNP